MHRQAAFLVLATAAGALIGALTASTWSRDAPLVGASAESHATPFIPRERHNPSGEPGLEALADAVDALTRIQNDEINERRVLTEQVERLQSELRDLKQNLGERVEEAFAADAEAIRLAGGVTAGQTREERLAAAGFTAEQLELIDRLEAEAEMAGIALDDRARREGWVNTPRYYRELQELGSSRTVARDVLGDELYDGYLYALGLPNRILVTSLVETSPAQQAGFRPGDLIVRYGGEKVYSVQQLIELRSAGQLGEPVTVEIVRDGQPLQLTIPRGPMGMEGNVTRVDPAAPPD